VKLNRSLIEDVNITGTQNVIRGKFYLCSTGCVRWKSNP